MKTSTRLLSILGLFTVTHLFAQSVPEYVNYQGLLKAADGSPLATGNYTIEFNIYDQANGGTKVWGPFLFDGTVGSGHGPSVPVVNGGFNVIIGPSDTGGASLTNAFAGPSRFIEIKVNGGTPILPRQQFLSTAYALQSQKAQLADVASMLITNLYEALCPPGTIVAFGGTSIPSGWLLCDGRQLTNAMYPKLLAAIGINWGNGTMDSNGNLENPANPDTGFNLPDLRGMFLRGMNGSLTNAAWTDPDRNSRTNRYAGGNTSNQVGSCQVDGMQTHTHQWGYCQEPHLYSWNSAGTPLMVLENWSHGQMGSGSLGDDQIDVENIANGFWTEPAAPAVYAGTETRPNNAYVNYIIKY